MHVSRRAPARSALREARACTLPPPRASAPPPSVSRATDGAAHGGAFAEINQRSKGASRKCEVPAALALQLPPRGSTGAGGGRRRRRRAAGGASKDLVWVNVRVRCAVKVRLKVQVRAGVAVEEKESKGMG